MGEITKADMVTALEYYADAFCELGEYHECCGKMPDDECSGCRARAILSKINHGGGHG